MRDVITFPKSWLDMIKKLKEKEKTTISETNTDLESQTTAMTSLEPKTTAMSYVTNFVTMESTNLTTDVTKSGTMNLTSGNPLGNSDLQTTDMPTNFFKNLTDMDLTTNLMQNLTTTDLLNTAMTTEDDTTTDLLNTAMTTEDDTTNKSPTVKVGSSFGFDQIDLDWKTIFTVVAILVAATILWLCFGLCLVKYLRNIAGKKKFHIKNAVYNNRHKSRRLGRGSIAVLTLLN